VTPLEVIACKRDGGEVPAGLLRALTLDYARGQVPDYQMAAFLMAGYLNGFTRAETEALTAAMVDSGERLDLSGLAGPTVDKHSTGGVADGTTLIVGPLAAAVGLQMVKLSGRGLGHTGGTLDKLESIPGLRTALTTRELLDQAERVGVVVAAQTADLVPADKALYALRDATATVANPALIAASVMSKKLAGGAGVILLDVKTGSGAFLPDPDDATELARTCVQLGRSADRTTAALVTDMSQPLGRAVGNALEVREAIEVLAGRRTGRLAELCLTLTGHLAALAAAAPTPEAGAARARDALASGHGLQKLTELIQTQGGDPRAVDDPGRLPQAPVRLPVHAEAPGWLTAVDTRKVGQLAAQLGAGRQRKDDQIDPAVGMEVDVKLGDQVQPGQVLGWVYARDRAAAEQAGAGLTAALTLTDTPRQAPPLVHGQVRA
jgi:pyrimidine-nucleoside phosphorylase